MTPLSAAPQSLPVIAPVSGHAAPGEAPDPAAGEDSLDFAAVLKAQIGQPAAKDVGEAEILAALLPVQTTEGDAAMPAADLPAAPDLTALLPALAVPAAATAAAGAMAAPAPAIDSAPEPILPASLPQTQTLAPGTPSVRQPQAAARMAAVAEHGQTLPPQTRATTAADDAASSIAAVARQPVPGEMRPQAAVDSAMPGAAAEHAAAPALAHAAAPLVQAGQAGESPAVARIDTPVGSRGWDAEVGQKVVWMVNRMEGRAELTLTPPQLGRVEVTISVSGDQTSATFVSASPAAREALEQALPRLREILAEAGISLGQASVNAGSTQGGREEAPAHGPAGQADAPAERAATPAAHWVRTGNGLIDTFA